jgi:hypothetical protein
MANWVNARPPADGPRDAVLSFAAATRDETARVFRADMLIARGDIRDHVCFTPSGPRRLAQNTRSPWRAETSGDSGRRPGN